MEKPVNALIEFIDSAVKSRKYPESTAQTLRAAIRLYEQELNDEEKASISLFAKNIDQIANEVFNRNKLKFSAGSLATYKSRVMKVLNDYNKYGTDPAKMASWSPKVITRTSSKRKQEHVSSPEEKDQSVANQSPTAIGMHKIELSLRPDAIFTVIIPYDISKTEAATLGSIISSLADKGSAE